MAQMVATDLFNQAAGRSGSPVFGCVTTGEAWQFLRQADAEALMDRRRHYIDNVRAILGTIQSIFGEGAATPGTGPGR